MTLRDFATAHRLRVRRHPEDGDPIIQGRDGFVYQYSRTRLAVIFTDPVPVSIPYHPGPDLHPALRRQRSRWRYRMKIGEAAGLEVLQEGDLEGTLSFDPADPEQVRVALKIAHVKRKRQLSPEQLANLRLGKPFTRKPGGSAPEKSSNGGPDGSG